MTPAQSLLRSATGLSLSRSVVEGAIKQRMAQTGSADADAYLQQMTPAEMSALVELVVVPESWFYRDPQAFQAMTDWVRARLTADPQRLIRILSIPCACGEEPYTIAMALTDAGIPAHHFKIDAFDISPSCVERANNGIYGRNAFRAQDLTFRDRHFSSAGAGDYRVNDNIRQQVRFRQGNLLAFDLSAHAGYYDVVFCRNLLIYFDKPTTKAAIARLRAVLADDGQLYAGYAEVPSFCQHGFTPLPHSLAFGLLKDHAPRLPAKAAPPHQRTTAAPAWSPAPVPAIAANLLADARRLADLGDLQAAERHCRDHLALHPESAEAYFILGLLNELTNKPKLAQDYWKRCIYLQPDHYQALCHLALLAEASDDASGAAALKARAARIYQRQQAS